MKKLIILLCALIALAGCSDKYEDPFKAYRGKTEAQIYSESQMYLAKGDYAEAEDSLEAMDALYPFGPHAQEGRMEVVYAYYMNRDYAEASIAADRYLQLYPRSAHVDYVYYMKALTLFRENYPWLERTLGVDAAPRDLGNKRLAFATLNQLIRLYPNSIYKNDAITRMTYLRNLFARREIMTAQFYYRRKAYVAAANRASYVVEHFEGSPEVVTALTIMVKSYRKMGMTWLADNTAKIFKASYPHDYADAKLS